MRRFILLALVVTGCSDFSEVDHRNIIDGRELDPNDAAVFAHSAQQNLAAVYPSLIMHSAWFAGEAIPADVVPDPHGFARRDVLPSNGGLAGVWSELSVARASADEVVQALERNQSGDNAIHLARAALIAGYAYVFMAEHFCEVAVDGRRISSGEALDRAIARFTTAGDAARTVTSQDARDIASAALVGRARALLHADRRADAEAAALQVPAGFEFNLRYVHDPAHLLRLGNRLWYFTSVRSILAVAPAFRTMADPRVAVSPPSNTLIPFDGVTEYWTQRKYTAYESPIRLASRLEADYIIHEARGSQAMLTWAQARRAANGMQPYAGPTDANAIAREFFDQRARDFFLEAQRVGPLRRLAGVLPYMPQPGQPYFKPSFGSIGSQVCWPLPESERGR